jgi:hypothetical protein
MIVVSLCFGWLSATTEAGMVGMRRHTVRRWARQATGTAGGPMLRDMVVLGDRTITH